MVPVDADIEDEDEVAEVCYKMQAVLNKMNTAGNEVNILILDACRDNPFERVKTLGKSGGLASMNPSGDSDTFIAYATAKGEVARDGNGFNSPFTAALVKEIHRPGLSIYELFMRVKNRVENATKQKQTPWWEGSMGRKFLFVSGSQGTVFPAPTSHPPSVVPHPPPLHHERDFETGMDAYDREDYETALEIFQPLANQGYVPAQYSLGVMYQNGRGVIQNYTEAIKWYRKAANQGLDVAQNNLGVMYQNGHGVVQNYTEAIKWYRKAANQGLDVAQNNLGVMYQNGHGVVQNYTEAIKWYRKAANQGLDVAQNNLGVMYQNGHGVVQNYTEAIKWYRKAANQGLDVAQNNLGVMYQNGYDVPQNYIQAHKWFNLAAAQEMEEARIELREVERKMEPSEIIEAQRLAREFKKR